MLALLALVQAAVTPSPAPPPALAPAVAPAPKPATVRVTLTTAAGPILLELEKERAPVTTANFLRYVDGKRLDGAAFYRASHAVGSADYGLVQFGVKQDPKRVLPPIAHEPTTRTGLSHKDGTLSIARNAPGSATGDFFIIVGDLTALDADPKLAGDNQGFAAFGRVVEGMDVVRHILAMPTSAGGDGVMKGEMLVAPVKILGAKRVALTP